MIPSQSKHKRVLLKISGEALMGDQSYGLDPKTLEYVINEVKKVRDSGVETAIVVGGGNIFRGLSAQATNIPRPTGDTMGMLATVMNGLALSSYFKTQGIASSFLSAFSIGNRVETFSVEKANELLSAGQVVLLGGGTSNPFFTTDTAAVLRALEINADLLIKATKVNGVYDSDPVKNPHAKFFQEITYSDVLKNNLRIMDGTAVALARDNNLPLLVLNLKKEGAMADALAGNAVGTRVIP
jgi:uridylate kinase